MTIVLLLLAIATYCLVEAISSKDEDIRRLRKIWWIPLILFLPLIGPITWLVAGRPAKGSGPRSEDDRPGRASAVDPESEAEFLRKVRERAEEQRRRAAEQKRREGSDEGS
jgi:hypothetical protein